MCFFTTLFLGIINLICSPCDFQYPNCVFILLCFFLHLYKCEILKKMNYIISFQERAKLALELLSKQQPVTLTMARNQAQRLKSQSKSEKKKQ